MRSPGEAAPAPSLECLGPGWAGPGAAWAGGTPQQRSGWSSQTFQLEHGRHRRVSALSLGHLPHTRREHGQGHRISLRLCSLGRAASAASEPPAAMFCHSLSGTKCNKYLIIVQKQSWKCTEFSLKAPVPQQEF